MKQPLAAFFIINGNFTLNARTRFSNRCISAFCNIITFISPEFKSSPDKSNSYKLVHFPIY
jgi:hypothetical protein